MSHHFKAFQTLSNRMEDDIDVLHPQLGTTIICMKYLSLSLSLSLSHTVTNSYIYFLIVHGTYHFRHNIVHAYTQCA